MERLLSIGNQLQYRNNFVISTGAQRSGEICGFLFRFSRRRTKPEALLVITI
jgi:hypothetical protein